MAEVRSQRHKINGKWKNGERREMKRCLEGKGTGSEENSFSREGEGVQRDKERRLKFVHRGIKLIGDGRNGETRDRKRCQEGKGTEWEVNGLR